MRDSAYQKFPDGNTVRHCSSARLFPSISTFFTFLPLDRGGRGMSAVNITVTDQSPAFTYSPDREGVSDNAWQSAWTGVSDANYDPTHTANNLASGISSHFTSSNGASVQIEFVGTAVTLYGQGSAGAYTTTLDDDDAISGSGGSVLATYGGLSNAKHTLTLQVTQSQNLTLSQATITIRTTVQPNSVTNTTQVAVTTGSNNTESTNSFFSTSGSGFSNQHEDQGYTRLDTYSSGSSISFTCSNTSALFVYGTSNWNHQLFSMEIDPGAGASQSTRIFNATTKWFVLNNLVFFETGMDPSQTYQVKMTNLGPDGSYSDIHMAVMMKLPVQSESSTSSSASGSQTSSPVLPNATFTASPTTTASSSSGVRKTAGIAVGAVAAVAAVILLAFFCWRRRSTNKKSRMSFDGMLVTPFGKPPTHGETLSSGSDTPIALSHYRDQSLDPYPGHQPHASGSATTSSMQDLRDRATGMSGGLYASVSTYDDFDPFSAPRPKFHNQSSGGSTNGSIASGSSSGPQSGPYTRSQEKGAAQTVEAASSSSSRLPRQEVDAGPVPDHPDIEETLPPGYDPRWAS